MTNLPFLDISKLSALIRNKQVSPVEITELMLSRIERYDPTVNAFIRVMAEEARAEARMREQEIMNGNIKSPLHGIPIAVKDMIQTKGVVTTAGSKVLEHWVPCEDATVIAKLKEAGAILIGKTNLHEFAMGATTENPHYGCSRNPWDFDKIPGGSSGGSAVAVACGMSYGALGTDTAGSIRLPSALCGTVGLKPTYGLVSRHGSLPFSWSLDHIGPMTRTVKDAAIMLQSIAGRDHKDPSTLRAKRVFDESGPIDDLRGFVIGVCEEYFFEDVDEEIRAVVDRAIGRLNELGATVVRVALPGLVEAQWAQRIIAQAEAYLFHEPMLHAFGHLYSADVKFRLEFGKNVSAADYLKAQKIRNKFIHDTLAAMDGIDILVSPMNHNPAFSIGSRTPEQAIHNMYHLSKAPVVSMLGFPALALPCGFTADNMPVGLQMVGKPFAEQTLILAGELYERVEKWADRLAENRRYEQGKLGPEERAVRQFEGSKGE